MAVDTTKVTGRRALHFDSLDQTVAEAERLAAGPYRQLGNWTLGQALMHLARGAEVAIDGTVDRPDWLFLRSADGKMRRPRWFLRMAGKPFVPFIKWYLRRWGPPPGIRPPGFIWKDIAPIASQHRVAAEEGRVALHTWREAEKASMVDRVTTEEALSALRRAISRLKSESGRDLEGLMTREMFDLYQLRHSEMHLSFFVPEDYEAHGDSEVRAPILGGMFVVVINMANRCAESLYNLLRGPAHRTPPKLSVQECRRTNG